MGSRIGQRRYKAVMSGWLGTGAEWRREMAAAAVLGLFLGLIGPFGTYSNGVVEVRIAYWVGILVFGLVVYGVLARWALHWGQRLRQPVWFTLPLAVLVISLPMSFVTSSVVLALWPSVRPHMHPLDWYAQAVVMGLPLSAAVLWSRNVFAARAALAPGELAPPPPEPIARSHGRPVLCLQMEDHYVRVHTAAGSELVLKPLKQAIAEQSEEGMQVHRSWWVARAAVDRPVQDGRNLRLRLVNGLEVPVSRSSVAALRANRWLDSVSESAGEA
jgi:hypothetical protein